MNTPNTFKTRFIQLDITRGHINDDALERFILEIQSDTLSSVEEEHRQLLECRSSVNELETQLKFWKAKAVELGYKE